MPYDPEAVRREQLPRREGTLGDDDDKDSQLPRREGTLSDDVNDMSPVEDQSVEAAAQTRGHVERRRQGRTAAQTRGHVGGRRLSLTPEMVDAPYSGTRSGKRINLLRPSSTDIDLDDITEALDRLPRWTGHTEVPYSVLQHSLCCLKVIEHLKINEPSPALMNRHYRALLLAVLLHDAHEAYMGDIATPVAIAIGDGVRQLKVKLQSAIHRHFGLPETLPRDHVDLIKFADRTTGAYEWATLMRRASLNMELGAANGYQTWMPRDGLLKSQLAAVAAVTPPSARWRREFKELIHAYVA